MDRKSRHNRSYDHKRRPHNVADLDGTHNLNKTLNFRRKAAKRQDSVYEKFKKQRMDLTISNPVKHPAKLNNSNAKRSAKPSNNKVPSFGDILRKARSCKKVDPSLTTTLNFQNFGTFGDQRDNLSTLDNYATTDPRSMMGDLLETKAVNKH